MLVDLSHAVENGMITYPGLPGPAITDYLSRSDSRAHYAPGTEFHIGRIEMVANTGTYLDVPSHRYSDGFDLADLPLESVVNLPGVVVPCPEPAIGPEEMDGREITGRAVLFSTGWDRHWRTDRYGDEDHPFLTKEAVERVVASGAKLVGIDSVNIDNTRDRDRPGHTMLLAAGICIVEHLTALDRLEGGSFRFFAGPPKVVGMGTFPIRAFALVD